MLYKKAIKKFLYQLKMVKKIFSFIKNKYVIVFIVLVTFILFFDKNDIFSQIELTKKLHQLQDEKKYFTDEVARNKADMNELKTNPKNLEKFAREKYLMKKDNEDIFVIIEQKK